MLPSVGTRTPGGIMGVRARRKSTGDLPPAIRAVLLGERFPEGLDPWDTFHAGDVRMRKSGGTPPTQEHWTRHREGLLEEWTRERPGTRPAGWWIYDSPQWPGAHKPCSFRALAAPRLIQLGGVLEEPALPEMWTPFQHCGLFRRAPWRKAMDGENELVEHPVESQPAYLKRYGLLMPEEEKRLKHAPEIELALIDAEAYGLEPETEGEA